MVFSDAKTWSCKLVKHLYLKGCILGSRRREGAHFEGRKFEV